MALHTDAGTLSDGYTVPIDGVVTSWRVVKSAPGVVRLYRLRPDGAGGDAANQQTAWIGETPPSARVGLVEEPARSPVQAGDELGLSFGGTLTAVGNDATAEILLGFGPFPFNGDLDVAAGRLLLQATVEPDVDGDGYGDDTQDHCPGPKSIPCATMGFVVDPAPPAMPGGSVTQALRVGNSGPGHTHPTTALEIKATRGAQATLDGVPCPNPDATSHTGCAARWDAWPRDGS